jgi:hypothetical protein
MKAARSQVPPILVARRMRTGADRDHILREDLPED